MIPRAGLSLLYTLVERHNLHPTSVDPVGQFGQPELVLSPSDFSQLAERERLVVRLCSYYKEPYRVHYAITEMGGARILTQLTGAEFASWQEKGAEVVSPTEEAKRCGWTP